MYRVWFHHIKQIAVVVKWNASGWRDTNLLLADATSYAISVTII